MTPSGDQARSAAKEAVECLQAAGHIAYWAGGCVRDMIISRPPKDYDIATNAIPERVQEIFPGATPIGKAFGVMLTTIDSIPMEIATFRHDHDYRDGRHPESVTFSDPETDAHRRDFTINAIFYDPCTQQFHDFVGGRTDIEAGIVRCVGDANARLNEDHLRILRAVRFSTTLGFRIEEQTRSAILDSVELLEKLSKERVREEFTRILCEAEKPGDALRLLVDLGIVRVLLPELLPMIGQEQPPKFHPEGDVFEHTVLHSSQVPVRCPRIQ